MKKTLLYGLAIALLLPLVSIGQGDYNLARVVVLVKDEGGTPIPRAQVSFSTFSSWVPGRKNAGRDDYNTVVGSTDTNGLVALSLKGPTSRYGCMVLPLSGYHWDKGMEYRFTNAVAGRWEPWSPLLTVVLKRKSSESEQTEVSGESASNRAPIVSKELPAPLPPRVHPGGEP